MDSLARLLNSVILSAVNGLAGESIHGVERPRVCLRLPRTPRCILTTHPARTRFAQSPPRFVEGARIYPLGTQCSNWLTTCDSQDLTLPTTLPDGVATVRP